jgi:hypothetical protein
MQLKGTYHLENREEGQVRTVKEVQVRVTYTLESMERVTCEDSEKKQASKALTL